MKKFPTFYRTRRFINCTDKNPPPVPDLSQPNQGYGPTSHLSSLLIFSSYLCLNLPSGLFPSGALPKTLHPPLLSPLHAWCHTHLILLDLSTQIFGDEYRSCSSSICSLLHSPVTSSLLFPNIFLSTLFPNTLSQCFSLKEPKFHTHIKWAKLYFCVF